MHQHGLHAAALQSLKLGSHGQRPRLGLVSDRRRRCVTQLHNFEYIHIFTLCNRTAVFGNDNAPIC